jgi:hypothetical protein
MRAALAGAPVDLLTIGAKAPALASQASVFASFEDSALGAGYAAAVHRYLDHFAARGIRRFEGALVVVGRRSDDSRDPPGQPPRRYTIGIQVAHAEYDTSTLERYLRGLDLLSLTPEDFDRACLRVSPYASVSDDAEADAGADDRRLIRIGAPGIGAEWRAGASQLAVLQAIDDAPSVGAALTRLAAPPGPGAGSRESLRATAREALIHGVLEVAS